MSSFLRRGISGAAALFLFGGVVPTQIMGDTINTEYRNVVDGIEYLEKEMFIGDKGKYRVNQLRIDMQNKDTGIVFAKEQEYALGKAKLSKHVESAIDEGYRVVGGINGDFFNVKVGVSVGPHIEDGKIITSFTSPTDRSKYPLIIQKKDGTMAIENKVFSGLVKVIKGNGGPDMPEEFYPQEQIKSIAFKSVNRYDEFIANRYDAGNYSTVVTPNYSKDRRLKKSSYAPNEVLVVLRGVKKEDDGSAMDMGLSLEDVYKGEVVSIGGNEDGYVPEDGIIIAASGTDAQWYKENVAIGDQIKIKASFGDKDIDRMMAAYSYLVKDGKACSEKELRDAGYYGALLTAKRSRSAFGIDEDGKLMAVVVEGGRGVREYSDGVSLIDFAKLLQEMGMVTAINLDGGGSTEMMLKKYAQEDFDILNKPEDGRERYISNSILFTTKKDVTNSKVESIQMKESFVMLKNTSYNLDILAENKYGYKIPVDQSKVKWKLSDNKASVANGVFESGDAEGLVMIEGEYGGKTSTSYAVIIDELDGIELNIADSVSLQIGDEINIHASGVSNYFGDVKISLDDVRWELDGNIGSIDERGNLSITKDGTGRLTCSMGEVSKSVIIKVGEKSSLIDDFEEFRYNYSIDGYMGGKGGLSQGEAYNGNSSFGMIYTTDTWKRENNGTVNMNFNGLNLNNVAYSRPKYLSAMVHSDGSAPWMRAEFLDGNGKLFTIDMEKEIKWTGWKQVNGEIPKDAVMPIKLERIYFVETNKDIAKTNGRVFIDDVNYVYKDVYINERIPLTTHIEPIYPLNNTEMSNGKFVIRAKVTEDVTEVDPYSVDVRIDGIRCTTVFDKETSELIAVPPTVLKNGPYKIIINAKNIYGESARRVELQVNVK